MSEASKIRELIAPLLIGTGLDLGCGSDKIAPHATGVDLRPGLADVAADLRAALPFESESQDFVFSSHALEDIQDTAKALREWWRVLRVGGLLVLYLPDARWYPNIGHPLANKAHKHDWEREEFMALLPAWVGPHEVLRSEDRPPPGGVYDYERRGKIEYSFLVVLRKRGQL